jgi:hypothetical protein
VNEVSSASCEINWSFLEHGKKGNTNIVSTHHMSFDNLIECLAYHQEKIGYPRAPLPNTTKDGQDSCGNPIKVYYNFCLNK